MEGNSFLSFLGVVFLVHYLVACFAKLGPNISTDQSALLSLKAHISDLNPHHVLANNWSSATPICSWIGITCGRRHQRVTALDISHMGLTGSIPPHLGNLSFLVSLDLSNNSFHGHLPKELAHLRRLKIMNFELNNFHGSIPSSFGALPKLQVMFLNNNSFTGSIPTSISNISKLEILILSYNLVQGMIPPNIGNLHNLKALGLRGNQLIGALPLTIFNMSSLQKIDITSNRISGTLPVDICYYLPKLEVLYLSINEFYGQIPSSLPLCSKLQGVAMAKNKLSGAIPKEIANLTMLKTLSLGGNSWTGEIPRGIANLSSLEILTIEHANLTGVVPQEIGNLYNLELLKFNFNNLRGSIPTMIFNISTLKEIVLSSNQLSGNLSSSIGHMLPKLEVFDLADNELDGILPDSISNASKLVDLGLDSNKFTGSIPDSIGNLRSLERLVLAENLFIDASGKLGFLTSLTNCRRLKLLWIADNPFNGILPTSVGNLSNTLEFIDVGSCRIRGDIPKEIGNLSKLVVLHLNYNDLTGFIPTTVDGFQKLQILGIGSNRLQGSIPNELCLLPQLGWLYLSQNELSGPVPPCLRNTSSLKYIYLDSNELNSTLPASLGSLKDLLELNLSSNSLSGQIPPEMASLKVATLIDLSMNQFSGTIPDTIGSLQSLISLSLANNLLQGPIPDSFSFSLSLEFLDLSYNNLSGEIPKSLEKLVYLKFFNVSFNRLGGEIPSGGPFINFTNQSFMSNEALCGAPQLLVPICHTVHISNKKQKLLLVYILVPVASILLAVTIIFVLVRFGRKKKIPTQTDVFPATLHGRITIQELHRATNGFSESNLLGMGGFGSVYKGILADGTTLAIKVFNLQVESAFKSFDTECEVLRNIRHINLTKVISTCANFDFKALILEYMPNGSLEKWLYSHNHFLDILQRLDIMIDVACALDYLHHGYSMPVVHCDLKPSNILLDEDMVAHVSDFGIAKVLGEGQSNTQTNSIATLGYIAPEYGMEGLVSTRCDVYSYGIILMETFTRRKPTDEIFSGDLSLKDWIYQSLPNAIIQVIDTNLLTPEEEHMNAKVQCVTSIMELALNCSAESPQDRIKMGDALPALKKIKLQFLSNCESTQRGRSDEGTSAS